MIIKLHFIHTSEISCQILIAAVLSIHTSEISCQILIAAVLSIHTSEISCQILIAAVLSIHTSEISCQILIAAVLSIHTSEISCQILIAAVLSIQLGTRFIACIVIQQPILENSQPYLQSRPTSDCIILRETLGGVTPTKHAWWDSEVWLI